MSLERLEKLLDLFQKKNLSELEYQEGNFRVKLKKPTISSPIVASLQMPADGQTASISSTEPALSSENKGFIRVESPMVGTFFRAPSPEAAPFVEEGQIIKKGNVLCIIEAMKLMNEIEAEMDGTIISIVAENAQPVEYGQPLFLLEPL